MTKEQRGAAKRLPGFGWLALIFIVPAVLYLATVYSQLSAVEARNLRLLAGAAERVEEVFGNAIETVGHFSQSPVEVGSFDERQPYLKWESSRKADPEEDPALRVAEGETAVRSHGADLLIVTITKARQDGGEAGEQDQKAAGFFAFEVDFDRILNELPLDNNPNPRTRPAADDSRYPLDHSSSPRAALADEGAFDYLILADHDGNVINSTHPAAQPGIRFSDLEKLGEAAEAQAEDVEDNGLSLGLLKRSGRIQTVPVAGTRYRLFSQPVHIATGDGETWVLAGLVASDRMLRETLTVAPQLAAALVLLFILGLLSWPILKVLAMDRRERMRFIDLYLLPMSSFAVLVVLTATLASVDGYSQLEQSVEQQLEGLADDIETELTRELMDLRSQLKDYDDELKAQLKKNPTLAERIFKDEPDDVLLTATKLLGGDAPKYPARNALLITRPDAYKYLTSVFWMNNEGMQFAKANIRSSNTSPVKLDHRDYFKAIDKGLHWSAEFDWFFQTYRSITTGERSAALSARSSIERGPAVAAITSDPRSVMNPVVPLGFSFALLDDRGAVQFHSDGRRALLEDFFSEVGNSDRLRAVMASRTDQHFNTSYLTRPHQLYVRPLGSGPWWIVTMYDREVSRTVVMETFGRTILFALTYLLALNLPLLIWLVFTRRHVRWIWPDPRRVGMYRLLFYQHLCFMAGYLFLVVFDWFDLPPTSAIVLALLLPAAAIVLAFLRCVWTQHDSGVVAPSEKTADDLEDPTHRSFLVWRTAAATAFWIVIAVLPTVGLFRIEWREQIHALVKANGLDASHALAERARQQKFGNVYENVPIQNEAGFFDGLWNSTTDLYLDSIFGETDLDMGGSAAPDVDPTLSSHLLNRESSRLLPLYNRTSRYLRYAHEAGSRGGRLAWNSDGEGLRLDISGLPLDRGATLRYSMDKLTERPGRYQIIGGLILLVVLVVWVRYGTYRVLFGAIAPQLRPLGVSQILRRAESSNVIALVASPVDRRELVAHNKVQSVDLGGGNRQTTEERIAELAAEPGPPVVCDRFEDDLVDADLRQWKLTQIEKLLAAGTRRIILPSAINIFEDLLWCARVRPPVEGEALTQTGGVGPAGSVVLSPSETRRWGRVLSEFILEPMGLTNEPQDLTGEPRSSSEHAALQALDRWQVRELVSTSGLWPAPVFHPESFRGLRRKDALERFVETFEGVYWALWTSSSPDEQLVLVHLAQEQAVNPKQAVTLRRLLQRGLVVRDPVLRMMNESFSIFVRRIHEPVEIRRWEREARGGIGWQQLRWAFLSLLAVLGLFLFATQQGLFQATVGFVSALAVGIPGVLKLISGMHGGGRSAPPG